MADKSYRIRVGVGSGENVVSQRLDKKISLQLRQGVMPISILSLEINPEDNYKVDTSGYGVIVGRVLANGSYGIPNVKVSVFVPLSTEDEADYVTSNEYPYATTMTKDMYGNRYNLVTKNYGSFPGKREVLDNEGVSEVYERYWQYTTTTNESGDYMIFGVPT